MKKNVLVSKGMEELSVTEATAIKGGNGITDYARCVGRSLTTGKASVLTAVMGLGIFGISRIAGAAVGCGCR